MGRPWQKSSDLVNRGVHRYQVRNFLWRNEKLYTRSINAVTMQNRWNILGFRNFATIRNEQRETLELRYRAKPESPHSLWNTRGCNNSRSALRNIRLSYSLPSEAFAEERQSPRWIKSVLPQYCSVAPENAPVFSRRLSLETSSPSVLLTRRNRHNVYLSSMGLLRETEVRFKITLWLGYATIPENFSVVVVLSVWTCRSHVKEVGRDWLQWFQKTSCSKTR